MIHSNIRQQLEEAENRFFLCSKNWIWSRQDWVGKPYSILVEFQHECNCIIRYSAFRQLKHKTQVFIALLGDHYATRLMHTLEVLQIAWSILKTININEDLAEAIALGHCQGHVSFEYVGKEVLNNFFQGHSGIVNEIYVQLDLLARDENG